jgi:SAM-dependent methyltransferase
LPLGAPRIFDLEHYAALNRARGEVVTRLLSELKGPLDLRTAIDVGCGLGHFSGVLQSMGFEVTGVDGRRENAEEAARRNPKVAFYTNSVEDPRLRSLGAFDLTFCFGLLYHLENPLLAVRHLHAMTKTLLLAEAVIFPGDEPVMALIDEEIHDDQGLEHIAFYPTEACLIKMLYRAGFGCAYRFRQQPDHPDYSKTPGTRRVRTMLAASAVPLKSNQLELAKEPSSPIRPWEAGVAEVPVAEVPITAAQRLRRFASKPFPDKLKTIQRIMKER